MAIEILNVDIQEKWTRRHSEAESKFNEAHKLKKQAEEVLHAINICTREGLVVCERKDGDS